MEKMTPEKQFSCLLRARETCFWVCSSEERRVERAIATEAHNSGYQVRFWDCASGAIDIEGAEVKIEGPPNNPHSVFEAIRKREKKEVWILRDLPDWTRADFTIARGLKSLARDLMEDSKPDHLAAVVILTSDPEIPPTLRGVVVSLDWPLPTRQEIREIVKELLNASEREIKNGELEEVVDAAAGLTASDVENAVAYSIALRDGVDPAIVVQQKEQIIRREKVLTWFEPDPRGLDAIGGLELLKAWLLERRLALSEGARAFGLPSPKGVLLAGVPGCGKSLTARALATAWGIPLLRMDLGALRSKYVGESETNLRTALRVAEAVAPVVLWLDEIEKAIGGSGERLDGGVSSDAVGTILTWLQEHEGSVFVIATANDVSALPPEMTRKGRFDEIFFVDLPTASEAKAVLATTIEKFNRKPNDFNLGKLTAQMVGFSGSEIAETVPSGLFRAFAEGERKLKDADILAAAATTVPLSESAKTRIDALRNWAGSHARPASPPEETEKAKTTATGRGAALKVSQGG